MQLSTWHKLALFTQKCCLFKLLPPGVEKWVLDLKYCIWLWLPVFFSCTDFAPDLEPSMLIYLHLSIPLGTWHLACLKEKPVFLIIVHIYVFIQTSAVKTLFFIVLTEPRSSHSLGLLPRMFSPQIATWLVLSSFLFWSLLSETLPGHLFKNVIHY